MALTAQEESRIQAIEQLLSQLKTLITNAASLRAMNKLLVLAQEETRRIEVRQAAIETTQEELIELARKLQ